MGKNEIEGDGHNQPTSQAPTTPTTKAIKELFGKINIMTKIDLKYGMNEPIY